RCHRDWSSDVCSSDLTAAACRNAGTLPMIEEPDIRVKVERRMVAIAAKRLLSAASLEKRIKEARDQIRRSVEDDPNLMGIIAIRSEERRVGKEWRCGL